MVQKYEELRERGRAKDGVVWWHQMDTMLACSKKTLSLFSKAIKLVSSWTHLIQLIYS